MYAQETPLSSEKYEKKSETIVVYRLEKSMGYIHRKPVVPSIRPSIQSNSINDASKGVFLTFSALCTPADARQSAVMWSLNNNLRGDKMKNLRISRD